MSYRICGVGFGDMHVCARAIPGRANYQEELESLIAQVDSYAKLAKADFLFSPGDFLHSKLNSTHADVALAAKLLRSLVDQYGPINAVPGNHDMSGNDPVHARERQPYAVLLKSGLIHDVHEETKIIEKDGCVLRIDGAPYSKSAIGGLCKPTPNPSRKANATLVLLHHEIDIDQSFIGHLVGKIGSYDDLVVVNGHLHDRCGVKNHTPVSRCKRITSASLGVLGRITRNDAAITPKLTHIVFKKDVLKVTQSPLEAPVGDELFEQKDGAGKIAPAGSSQVEEFIATLRATESVASADPIQLVREQGKKLKLEPVVIDEALRIVSEER